jgi:hypothetical protein
MKAEFKPGKLYICSPEGTFAVFPWPNLRSSLVASRPNWGVWAECMDLHEMEKIASEQEDLRAAGDENGVKRAQMCRAFVNSIPVDVLKVIKPFPDFHRGLLYYTSHCPGFQNLAMYNPGLAYCLAMHRAFHKPIPVNNLRSVRLIVRKKQPDIAGWLGFPATEFSASVLRNMKMKAISKDTLKDIRNFLRVAEARKLLGYLPIYGRWMVRIIKDKAMRKMATTALLQDLIECDEGIMGYIKLKEILELLNVLGRPARYSFKSYKKVEEKMFRLHQELGEKVKAGKIKLNFPRPPYPGDANIIPLDSPGKLVQESVEQSNRLKDEILYVLKGWHYFYKVTQPERATLELRRNVRYDEKGQPPWIIEKVEAAGNEKVRKETEEYVKSWFEKALGSQPIAVR